MPRNGQSRTADKFVVRMPNGMRDQVEETSGAAHISMNTFLVQAIEEKLARDAGAPDLLGQLNERLAAVEKHLGSPAGLLS